MNAWLTDEMAGAVPLEPVTRAGLPGWLERQTADVRRWVEANAFTAAAGSFLSLPGGEGGIGRILAGVESTADIWALASLPEKLPRGVYRLDDAWPTADRARAALGWGLGAYRFRRYRSDGDSNPMACLVADDAIRSGDVADLVEAVWLVRDLVNTPPQDMMPAHLAEAAHGLAAGFGARFREVTGDALRSGYPCLHVVGQASAHPPRMIELDWGDAHAPAITLVGKGVCFDSGGLDLKPSSGMRLMKKDMGGAAHALGLARLIMGAGLPVHLRVLIGAAENAVSGSAFRPGDVVVSRKGLTVEIENTDAEGRLAICDLLTQAGEERPDLVIDFATLTGAARVALGTDIGAYFATDDALAARLDHHAREQDDPLWRLPLHKPYRCELDSKVADLLNCSAGSYGGAITAALFLKEFVPDDVPWLHFDVMAWNRKAQPGRPEGGEAMGLRAVFALLCERFG